MSWLVDPGFEYSPTGTGGGSGWEPGYVTNLSTINSGIKTTTPRSGSQHLQLAVLASAASERYWYSDPWIKVASGDVITFGGYLRAIGLVGGSAGFRLIVKNAAETTSTFASTTFMGGTFSYISRFETTQITGDAIWARVQCCVTNTASAGTALFDDCSMNENSLVIIHGNPGSSRIAIDGSGIYGYNGSTAQFYIRSTDGAAMCGGGYVKLDSSGIILDSPGETLTIGSPITGGSNTNTVSGYYFLTRFQAEKTSTNMDVALKAAASGIYLWSAEVALYSDSVGSPGTLLGTKQLLGSPDSFYQGWNIYQLSTPGFSVTAGTYYWVGFQAEVSGIVWETGGTGRYSTSLTGWPASNPTMSSNTAIYRIRLLSGALDTTPIKFMNYEEKCAEMYGDTGYDFSNSKGLTMWQQDYMNIKFGSSEGFVVISGRLTVTGHATISSIGNANTVGTIYEGGAAWIKLTGSPGHITIAGNIEPYLGNSYIFGSSAKPWKEIWATGFYSTGHLYVIPNSGQDLWLGVSGRYVVPAYHDTVHLGDVNYRWYDVVTPRINSGNTSDLVMTTPTGYCVRPVNNGQIHLGHASYRWGNIHCNNLYIAGVRCDYDEYWAAKTPTATGWTTWELSGTLELGTKMVWVVVSNFHSSNQYDGGIRAVGSGSSRYFTLFPGCRLCMPVWVNSSRQIQIYCTNTSYVNFYVLGGVIWPD